MLVLGLILAFFVVLSAVLSAKLILIHHMADELRAGFAEITSKETNILLTVSSGDKKMRLLCDTLNRELRSLREDRLHYQSGDREMTEAVTNISHDLRTPLTAICGYLSLLEREETSEKVAGYLEVIKNRTEAMKHLTEELFSYSLLLSPKNEPQLEEISLGSALEEAIAQVYAALNEKNIAPEIEMPAVPVKRQLDGVMLSRIFGNILSNAIKYSGGDLKIRLDDSGLISFSNSAPQLDEIRAGKLFDRFYTVQSAEKSVEHSTGLGLAIVKLLVKQLGGRVWAEFGGSRLTIFVEFPK